MKILSWDVGVCNLAYCYFIHDENVNSIDIKEWGKINLCIDYHVCHEPTCGNQAIYSNQKKIQKMKEKLKEKDSKTMKSSSKPLKKGKPSNEDVMIGQALIDGTGLDCTTGLDCMTGHTVELPGLSYHCKEHKDKSENLMEKIRSSKNMESLRRALYMWLITKEWNDLDHIAIENQPALKNPGMKTMACAIFDYYELRHNILNSNKSKEVIIKFISPMNKTRIKNFVNKMNIPDLLTIPSEIDSIEPKYKRTKAVGIWLCTKIMENYNLDANVLGFHTKQDDLADAFLQGLTLIRL